MLGCSVAAEIVAPPAAATAASPANEQMVNEALLARLPPAARPLKYVIKDAKEMKGFFTLYQKDEKVWIEIRPEQFNKPFFFSFNISSSVGERHLYGSQAGGSHVAVFKRIGERVQLLAKNTKFTAQPGTPQAIAVSQAFSDSLLGSVPVVSAPDPISKAILIEASTLLFSDIPNYSAQLDAAYHLPYGLDSNNTSFTKVRAEESLVGFQVNAHFFTPRIAAPQAAQPVGSAPSGPPTTTPDPRSFFIGFYYSFVRLPTEPMAPRIADDRIGHVVTTHYDFTEDLAPQTAVHYVNRWRLEKADPTAELSEPKQPIVYWLDMNIPEKYRKAVAEGVIEWNRAFEKIGFKNALVVKQQVANDDFDTMDARHASIHWYFGTDANMALGPAQVDPRSGEILDAHIALPDAYGRSVRRVIHEDLGGAAALPLAQCMLAGDSAQELGFATDLLAMRSAFDVDSPAAEALAQAFVKQVIMHEVGHTLGLRHNFRASTIYSLQQLQDPAFTKMNGLGGSVMDYMPLNLAAKGEPQGEYVMSTLGPYDYWAIEYAYKQLPSDREKESLEQIAARSSQPQLAYGTDEDAGVNVSDPEVNMFDLGGEPLAYFKKRMALSRELWADLQTRRLKAGDGYDSLRRSFDYGFNQFAAMLPVAVKYIGGTRFVRDHAGTERATFTPVDSQRQRRALALITDGLFAVDSFKFAPEFLNRLGVDHFESGSTRTDSVASRVVAMQISALDQLMADPVATRLLDAQERARSGKNMLSLSEFYDTLQNSIWDELKSGKNITRMRRNLQREHLKRLAAEIMRPSPSAPSDACSLQRANAISLRAGIRTAMTKPISREAKAHLAESLNTLDVALKASALRANL